MGEKYYLHLASMEIIAPACLLSKHTNNV